MSPATLAWFAGIVLAIILLTAIFGLSLLFVVILIAIALYLIGTWVYVDDRRPDEIHYIKTKDGWDLAIWRVRPKIKPANSVPVLLQHGLGANQRNFDLDDRCSLAHYLARSGYDCFLPALRGCGPSAYRQWRRPNKWKISFDEFVDYDLPACIDKILELTGARKLHFIGQSMGAMIGYAMAEGEYGNKMMSYTAVCGPCFFKHMQQFRPILPFRFLIKPIAVIRQSFFTRMQAPLLRFFPRFAGNDEVNWRNMDGKTLARAAANVMDDIPRDLILQFAEWIENEDFGSHRGAESWEKNLHKITIPIYCLGGSADRFCVPAANDKVIDKVSSAKKQYRLFSKENGDLADYGHGDIIVGLTAPDDVFPTILEWLHKAEGNQ